MAIRPCVRFALAGLFALVLPGSLLAAPPAKGPGRTPAPAARVAKPSKMGTTLLYGDDHCFSIVPPDGWTVDDQSGLGSRIRTVLYPAGQKWENATTVMYVNPLHQDPRARHSLDEMIARDVQSFRKQSPRGIVTPAGTLNTLKGKLAQVRYFAPTGGKPTTAVAYVEEADLVMLLVLDSRSEASFQSALPAFRQIVTSYQFVAGNIETPTGPVASPPPGRK